MPRYLMSNVNEPVLNMQHKYNMPDLNVGFYTMVRLKQSQLVMLLK